MAELKKNLLRECPFCGSENLYIIHDKISLNRKTFVECQDCKATAPIEAWNNRTTESKIRAKAISDFLQFVYDNASNEEYANEDGWAMSDLIDLEYKFLEQLKESE